MDSSPNVAYIVLHPQLMIWAFIKVTNHTVKTSLTTEEKFRVNYFPAVPAAQI